MQVNSNKYRRKKADMAGTMTLASGDSLTAASGSTVTLSGTVTASSATLALPASQAMTTPVLTNPLGAVACQEALFTQASINGTKTHTATFTIPAGSTILDIWVTNVAVWTSDTSATLKIGLVDDDCFYTAVDVKSTPAAGFSLNFNHMSDQHGASIPEIDGAAGNTELGATNGLLYLATAQSLTAIITDISTGVHAGPGSTRVLVMYAKPATVISPTVV